MARKRRLRSFNAGAHLVAPCARDIDRAAHDRHQFGGFRVEIVLPLRDLPEVEARIFVRRGDHGAVERQAQMLLAIQGERGGGSSRPPDRRPACRTRSAALSCGVGGHQHREIEQVGAVLHRVARCHLAQLLSRQTLDHVSRSAAAAGPGMAHRACPRSNDHAVRMIEAQAEVVHVVFDRTADPLCLRVEHDPPPEARREMRIGGLRRRHRCSRPHD